MAEKDVLSQEEIDALLEAVDEPAEGESEAQTATEQSESEQSKESGDQADSDEVFEPQTKVGDDGVKTLTFTGQKRIVKGQLPVLDKIYDRAVRYFASDIYQLTAKDFEIKQEPLLIVKHRDFMGSLPNPSLMSIYKFKPLRGKAIVLFDSIFVYDLVDYYFGGSTHSMLKKIKPILRLLNCGLWM